MRRRGLSVFTDRFDRKTPLRSRSRKGCAGKGSKRGRFLGLAAIAFVAGAAATPAPGASFVFENGLRLEGEISAFGRRFVTIETEAGARLAARRELVEVLLPQRGGGVIRGRLRDWRDGAYTVETPDGLVIARDRSNETGRLAAAALNSPAAGGAARAEGAPPSQTAAPSQTTAPSVRAAPSERAAPPERSQKPPPPSAESDDAWMTSPNRTDDGEDSFQVLVEGPDGALRFENQDAPSNIDPSKADPAGDLNVGKPSDLAFRSPNAPSPSLPDAPAEEGRSDVENGAVAQAPRSRNGAPAGLAERPGGADQPADLSAVRGFGRDAGNGGANPGAPVVRDGFADFAASGADPIRGMLGDILSGGEDSETAPEKTSSEPPSATAATRPSAPPDPAPASTARGAGAPTAAAPLEGPIRDPATDYLEGVLGADAVAAAHARSCARLSRLVAPPPISARTGAASRSDSLALVMAVSGELSSDTLRTLSRAFFNQAGAVLTEGPTNADAALSLSSADRRLARPWRVVAHRHPSTESAQASLAQGRADLALAPPPIFPDDRGPQRRLIGFDAVALVAHTDNPVKSLTRGDLRALLSGSVSDWSMIEPSLIGAPTVYLPPKGSSELAALAALAEVRRIRPASARYLPNPADRIKAAQADPMGLAIVSRSVLGEAEPLSIGRPAAGVAPTLDSMRSGSYPLVTPIYAEIAQQPAHPAAGVLAAFLSSPAGQRAIFEAGLAPVAACDPSTCTLSAEGLAQARERLATKAAVPPLTTLTEKELAAYAGAKPVKRLAFPAGAGDPPRALVAELAQLIDALARDDGRPARLTVVARAGLPGSAPGPERKARAGARAEATALALRCAGLPAERFGVDPAPVTGSTAGSAELVVEIQATR